MGQRVGFCGPLGSAALGHEVGWDMGAGTVAQNFEFHYGCPFSYTEISKKRNAIYRREFYVLPLSS